MLSTLLKNYSSSYKLERLVTTENPRSKDLGLGFGLVLFKKCYFKLDFFATMNSQLTMT